MKYCGNCGAEMQDNEQVCSNCKTEFIEFDIEIENKIKKAKKKKKIISAIVIILVLAAAGFVGLKYSGGLDELKKGYNDAISSQEETPETAENKTTTQPKPETTTKTTTEVQKEVIDIMDYIDNFDELKSVLGKETEEQQIIDDYTQYTFNEVTVLYDNSKNEIYCVTVSYRTDESKEKYLFNSVNPNSSEDEFEKSLGELTYQGYDNGGAYCYYYNKVVNGIEYDTGVATDEESGKVFAIQCYRYSTDTD